MTRGRNDREGEGDGHDVAPILVRFQLSATLVTSPVAPAACSSAAAVVVGSTGDGTYYALTQSILVWDASRRHFGLSGEGGWALFSPENQRFEIIEMNGDLFRHGKVYGSPIGAGGTGIVELWYYDGASETNLAIQVSVRDWTQGTYAVGDPVEVILEPKSARWYLVGGRGAALTYFELTANLQFGVDPGSDNAKIIEWDGDSYEPTGAAIRVFDWTILGAVDSAFWVGRAPAGAVKGYRGFATIGQSGRYEIVWMETQARFIKFRTQGQLKYNVASIGGDLLDYFDGREPPAGTVTLYNVETDAAGVYEFYGPDNAVGYAVWNDASQYRILWLETQAKWIEGTYDATSAGTAAFSAGTAADADVVTWWDGKQPPAQVDVHDPAGLFTRALQTGAFLARWNERYDSGNGGYIVVESESKAGWIDVTLTNAMASSNSTGATVNRYGGSQQDIQDPGSAVTVYDDQDLWKYAPVGAKGRAIYDASADRYRLVACQLKKQYLRGTISGALGATGTLSITASYGNGVAVSGSVTVQNPGSFFTGAGGEEAMAIYDADADQWLLVWVECP
jgi:hypothetical protein